MDELGQIRIADKCFVDVGTHQFDFFHVDPTSLVEMKVNVSI